VETSSEVKRELQLLKRQVRFLIGYAVIFTVIGAYFLVKSMQTKNGEAHFNTLSAERVNIVEPDGTVKLSLFDKENLPAAVVNGIKLPRSGGGESGMMFYNEEGIECGGFIYGGRKINGNASSGMGLTFDKYKQDQEIQIYHDQQSDSGKESVEENAVIISDRPDWSIDQTFAKWDSIKKNIQDTAAQRLAIGELARSGYFGRDRLIVGKVHNKNTGLFINDAGGKPRLNIFVDTAGKPHIQFFDDKGTLISELPGSR